MKRLNDRDTFLILAVVAAATAGLFYALRSRGPVRVVPSSEADVAMVSDRASAPIRAWRGVVLHHSATPSGNAAYLDRIHPPGAAADCLAFHFLIGNGLGAADGEIQVGARWRRQTPGPFGSAGKGDLVNICLVGDLARQPPTRMQMASLTHLLRYLQGRFGLSCRDVRLHREADPGFPLCPGDQVSLDAVQARLLP